ncbi:hypothetical protein IIV31_115L [Armadillidium vulgare iridescent virus]|uniref:Uncharacterized protein n=1 Tax=Armadillidium vulgare iridescent virus TaxID=72201 RepID=A0A068QKD3_9VIRU|nr:hypothetical protein IIV31_115L [Armadillidium vulgare iridescent virus]CCV02487.1 hypothetical protein IIV31_115L [Armadillidium vulgare iridescent virus]
MTSRQELAPIAPSAPTVQFEPYNNYYPRLLPVEYDSRQEPQYIPAIAKSQVSTEVMIKEDNPQLYAIISYRKKLEKEQHDREKLKKRYSKIDKTLFGLEWGCMLTELGLTGAAFTVPVLVPISAPICLGLTVFSAFMRNASKMISKKIEKHAAVELLAMSKMNSILEKYTKAIEDNKISSEEFKDITKEIDNFNDMKKVILSSYHKNVKEIELTKEIQQSFIDKGKEQVKKDLENKLKQI